MKDQALSQPHSAIPQVVIFKFDSILDFSIST